MTYTLPGKDFAGLQEARFFLRGTNLATISKTKEKTQLNVGSATPDEILLPWIKLIILTLEKSNKMKKYIIIILLISSLGLFSCEKFLEPGRYNDLYEEDIYENPTYAEGLLMTAYNGLPNDNYFYFDVATDDAVTNLDDSQYRRMATGEWSSQFYPGSPWNNAYTAIILY